METPDVKANYAKKRKPRTVDPTKMTYIKAFQIWREKQEPKYVGLSPKKGTPEYDEIMKILRENK